MAEGSPPLDGLRVVELGDARGELCARMLCDLGADVIRVEPPEGADSRREAPLHEGVSLAFAVRNAGKRSVTIDLPRGRDRLLALLAGADVWVQSSPPGWLRDLGLTVDAVRARHPELVVISISDFGLTGPYRDWVASEPVLLAMGGVLSRSGLPGRAPLLPPGGLARSLPAAQATWAVLAAVWNRMATGRGDRIDFSLYEATAQVVEPAMGTLGTAQAAGYAPTRSRPAPGPYPIFRCRDGHVRVALLAPRQWQAMREWLGDPEDLRDPELETIRGRALAAERLHAILEGHFAGRGKHQLALEGQARGVPIAPVLSPAEVLTAEHFRARRAIARRELAPGLTAEMPVGCAEINGGRVAAAGSVPRVGEDNERSPEWSDAATACAPSLPVGGFPSPDRRPFEGIRVLDLGVIVYGAEVARLFCELGADVIKLESRAFPDGARVSPVHFAIGHRGSRSFGVNLRSPDGVRIVLRLVEQADVLLANFKPGTLDKVGLGPETLHAVNPRLVIVNASALGSRGPWSSWMGYGPLVRCVSGLTSLWRYPDDPHSFSDSTVVHPDHFAARIAAVTAMAALIARQRTGRGARVDVAQAEAILTQLADRLAAESLLGPAAAEGIDPPDAPWGVYPCAGDDEWCVVTVRDDRDWGRLRGVLGWATDPRFDGAGGRLAHRAELDRRLSAWTSERSPRQVTRLLQHAGVPAGFMQRPDEYEHDPQLQARDFLRSFEQPGLEPRRIENAPFRSEQIAAPPATVAPEPGAHTREICAQLLGMTDAAVDALVEAGVLEEEPKATRTSVLPTVSPAS